MWEAALTLLMVGCVIIGVLIPLCGVVSSFNSKDDDTFK